MLSSSLRTFQFSFSCRLSLLEAKPTWPDWLLQWIGRTDIIATRSPSGYLSELAASVLSSSTSSSSEANKQGDDLNSKEELDGLKMVEKLCVWRFPEDERLTEVTLCIANLHTALVIYS